MNTHTITLAHPFDFDGVRVVELNLRRPKLRDLRQMTEGKGSDTDRTMRLVANLAEVDPKLLDELDPEDFGAVNEWLEPILDPKGRSRDPKD